MIHKVIVVGCGNMSNTWLDYVDQRENTQIVALVDLNIDCAIAMAQKRKLNVPVYSELSQALTNTEANLVFDITIPSSHKYVAKTALEAGCNVFSEKPMTETMQDAKDLIVVTESTGKKYTIMQNRRYIKQIRAFRDILNKGSIGAVDSLHADFFLGAHFDGFRSVMDSPLLLDMAIHTFDQARFISGADPVSVYCHEYNPKGSWYKGNASSICIFEMSDGSVFSYRGSWSAEGFNTSWEGSWRATGEKGTVLWDGNTLPSCEVIDETKPKGFTNVFKRIEVSSEWYGNEGHWGCLDEMFASIEENRLAETDSRDNVKSMAMVFGALESARKGTKIIL
ncbi:Gfo/Idh/MocA family protein [Peribacillus muralis]|uniref:Gfo/Idh/MocA family protein n=1 Tax=Peribacillus muralis TaxID=264697 RepID=UPI00070A5CEF|nr:Gfo/Idh/MocA family oxidoreductase [Peribacillus muralis]